MYVCMYWYIKVKLFTSICYCIFILKKKKFLYDKIISKVFVLNVKLWVYNIMTHVKYFVMVYYSSYGVRSLLLLNLVTKDLKF